MNKKTLMYGALIFFVGVAMVACGKKSSNSSATPAAATNTTAPNPYFPTSNGSGGFNQINASCINTGCNLNVTFQVANQQNFLLMASYNQRLVAQSGLGTNGGWNIPVNTITQPDTWMSGIGSFLSGCQLNIGGLLNWGTNNQWSPTVGVGCGGTTLTSNGTVSSNTIVNNTAYLPNTTTTANASMSIRQVGAANNQVAQVLSGTITLANGQLMGFEAVSGSNYGGYPAFVDQTNRMVLVPRSDISPNVVQVYVINQSSQPAPVGQFSLL